MNTLNKTRFWNLEKDYYVDSENVGADFYNDYESFIKGSKIDSSLKNFKYNNPFSFIPSYNSSVSITFLNKVSSYGDNYISIEPQSLNRIIFEANLNFDNRNDDESSNIVEYINSKKGADYFPLQMIDRNGLSDENAYKSLFSIKPYFVQEFSCNKITSSSTYKGDNNIQLIFLNDLITQATVRNIIYVNSMPEDKKQIINEYWHKEKLDIRPSYPLSREEDFKVSNASLGSSKTYIEKDGVNPKLATINLNFNGIDDDTLLKLLAFFLSKQGYESFEFELEKPEKKVINVTASKIQHTFLYMNSHNVSISISEVPVRRKFFFKP